MAEVIIAEQTFVTVESFLGFGCDLPDAAIFNVGETYIVYFDGEVYQCVAQDASSIIPGYVAIGNGENHGLLGNGEPFGIVSDETGYVTVVCLEDTASTSHTIAVYKAETEVGIIVKDRDGNDEKHIGATGVRVRTLDGGTKVFIDSDTLPVPEEKMVELDFSAGDMDVMPEDGKVFGKVTIPIPDTLIPENIAEGVNIAGIIGTFVGKGSNGIEDFNVFAKFWNAPTGTSTSANYIAATANEIRESGIELKQYLTLWTAVLVVSVDFPYVPSQAKANALKFAYRQSGRLVYYSAQANIPQGLWVRQTDNTTPAYGYAFASNGALENDITNTSSAYPGLSPTYGLFFNYNNTSTTRPIGPYLCIVLQHKTKAPGQMADF